MSELNEITLDIAKMKGPTEYTWEYHLIGNKTYSTNENFFAEAEGLKHVKEAHGFTDEQLNDPNFLEESKKLIKKT